MPIGNRMIRMTLEQARSAAASMPTPAPLDDAEIERRAESDPDAPLATDEQLAEAVREFADGARTLRPKQLVSLRIDPDVLDAYRSTGRGWQSRMHQAIVAGVPVKAARSAGPKPSDVLTTLENHESRLTKLEDHMRKGGRTRSGSTDGYRREATTKGRKESVAPQTRKQALP